MSVPLTISFPDDLFEKVTKASVKQGKTVRDFIKETAVLESEKILKGAV